MIVNHRAARSPRVFTFFALTATALALLTCCDKKQGTQSASTAQTAAATQPAAATGATPTPASQPPGSIIMQTYDQEADPKYGLPAQLQDPEVKAYSARLDSLLKRYPDMLSRLGRCEADYQMLFTENVRTLFHNRVSGGIGFKDKQLPIDWSKHSGDFNTSPAVMLLQTANIAGDLMPFLAVKARAGAVDTHLIGGHLLSGDIAFIDTLQHVVERVNSEIDASENVLADLFTRYNREFPENQLEYLPLSYHPANLSADARNKLIAEVKHLIAMNEKLFPDSHAYEWRTIMFRRSFKAIADAGETLKNKDLPRIAATAAEVKVPAFEDLRPDDNVGGVYGPLPAKYHRRLTEFLSALNKNPATITTEDINSMNLARDWTLKMTAAIERANVNLDEVRDLLVKEGYPLASDAVPHSFSGEGHAYLDRVEGFPGEVPNSSHPYDPDDHWDEELQKKADGLRGFFLGIDQNPFFRFTEIQPQAEEAQKIHPVWRHEIYQRIVNSTVPVYNSLQLEKGKSQPFGLAHFSVDDHFKVPLLYEKFAVERQGDEFAVPCKFKVPGDVAQVLMEVTLVGFRFQDKVTLDVKSSATGKSLLDAPVQPQNFAATVIFSWGADPRREHFEVSNAAHSCFPQHGNLDLVQDSVVNGLTVVVSDATCPYKLPQVVMAVSYTPHKSKPTK